MSLKEKILREDMGFVKKEDLPILVEEDRFTRVLVRCNGCRFVCSVQDADHLTNIIHRSRNDYVRDVSIVQE